MSLTNVRIVLVRPRGSANVGAVARAMKNMGLDDLAVVQPAPLDSWAEAMAAHAREVLESRRRYETVADAVADCGLVVGTTCHDGPYRAAADGPRGAAPRLLAAAAANRVAVVFGPEDHGLSNEDLLACQQLITIPASPAYPSLNLAQAVMLCCYELFLAAQCPHPEARVLASAEHVERMFEHLCAAFLAIGFLKPDNPDHIMHAVRRMLGRAEMDDRDVRIWLGLARQINWAARVNGDVSEVVPEPRTPNLQPRL